MKRGLAAFALGLLLPRRRAAARSRRRRRRLRRRPRRRGPHRPRSGFIDESRAGDAGGRRHAAAPPVRRADDAQRGPAVERPRGAGAASTSSATSSTSTRGSTLVPGLAEGCEVSADGLAYTITLRADAVWEDGAPGHGARRGLHDPEDRRSRRSRPTSSSRSSRSSRRSRRSTRGGSGSASRSRTRSGRWPSSCRCCPSTASPAQNFLKAKDNRAPLSDGPYRVVSWKTQESVELERNAKYPGPRGHFDRIVFRILPDNTTAYRLLLAGELDEDQIDAGPQGPGRRATPPSRPAAASSSSTTSTTTTSP